MFCMTLYHCSLWMSQPNRGYHPPHPPTPLPLHWWTYWFLCFFSRVKAKWERTGFSGRRRMCMLSERPAGDVQREQQQPPWRRQQKTLWWPSHFFICSRISPYWWFPCRGKMNKKIKTVGSPGIFITCISLLQKKKKENVKAVFVWRTFLSWEWVLFTDKFLFFVLSILRFV